jgi:hypothetical protein
VLVQRGKWVATTQQNVSFAFYVGFSVPWKVEYFEDVRIRAGACDIVSSSSQNYSTDAAITNNQFVIPLSRLVVSGAFTSATSASGVIEYSDPQGTCGGPVSIPWTARWSASVTPTADTST